MKYIILIMLITVSCFAQDNVLQNFTNAEQVNSALLKAQSAISGSGTSNQIAYWINVNTLGSLATNTYPSLNELRYVKGVTSAIQTQLNNKQATLVSGNNIKTVNGQSLVGSGNIVISTFADTTGQWQKIYDIVNQLIIGESIIGTKATLDSMIIDFRKKNSIKLNTVN